MTAATTTNFDVRDLRARYLAAQLRGDRREALRIVIDEGSRAERPFSSCRTT